MIQKAHICYRYYQVKNNWGNKQGVISRKLRGQSLLLKLLYILGAQPPKISCINLTFHKYFALHCSDECPHCHMAIEILLDTGYVASKVHYITIILNYHASVFINICMAVNSLHPIYDIAPRASLVSI